MTAIREGPVLVIGSAGIDIVGRPRESLQAGATTPGIIRTSAGGVGRNVAENLARLGTEVVLITAVGDDAEGRMLLEQTAAVGVDVSPSLVVPDRSTGAYLGVLNDSGALQFALDDMRVADALTSEHLRSHAALFQRAAAVFVDGNLPARTLSTAVSLARRAGAPLAADPATAGLAPRLVPHLAKLWLVACNEAEGGVLCTCDAPPEGIARVVDSARRLVGAGVQIAVVAMAAFGVGYASPSGSGHVPALRTEIADPTGAGDALTAATLFALLNEIPVDEAVRLGVAEASLALRAPGTTDPDLTLETLYEQLR